MAEKKDRSRFSLKFNLLDPAHEKAVCMLESLPERSKASFIVNAVLHYMHCQKMPDTAQTPIMGKAAIETVVLEILRQQGITQEIIRSETSGKSRLQELSKVEVPVNFVLEGKETEHITEEDNRQINNLMNDKMRDLIANTMSAFRNG